MVQDTTFILDLNNALNRLDHGIISLSIDAKQDNLVIGTRSAEIYHGKIGLIPEKLLEAHFEGEVWGCAVDPTSTKFATSGGDKFIRIWDIATKKLVASSEILPNDVRAIDWSPSGQMIIAGDSLG